ncbi:MAG: helix-turn-helix domain-containing protein [Solirubrobacteraceae bacterium]
MDLTIGSRVGRITIIGPVITRGKRCYSLVRCDCGREWEARRDSIRRGMIVCCGRVGCRQVKPKHGMAATREYEIWAGMIQRCHNPKAVAYRWYGARGIAVCERWRSSFANFFADMGLSPPGLELDRRENDKGYEPGNCRWITHAEQMLNTRRVYLVELGGEMMSLHQASRRLGVPRTTLYAKRDALKSPQRAVDFFAPPTAA